MRRLVHESIRAGQAGIRIDDQPIEGKRSPQSAGIEVVSIDQAVERYQAAVHARDELDPDFVIMAQCYARDAVNGGLSDLVRRLDLYLTRGKVDWVQFECRTMRGPISRCNTKATRTSRTVTRIR